MGNRLSNKVRHEQIAEVDQRTLYRLKEEAHSSQDEEDNGENNDAGSVVVPKSVLATTFHTSYDTGSVRVTCHSRRRPDGTTTTIRTIDKTAEGIRVRDGCLDCDWKNQDPLLSIRKDVIDIEDEYGNELSLGGFHKLVVAGFPIRSRRLINGAGRRNFCIEIRSCHGKAKTGLIHPESLYVHLETWENLVLVTGRRVKDDAEIRLKLINRNSYPLELESTSTTDIDSQLDTLQLPKGDDSKEDDKAKVRVSPIDIQGTCCIRFFFD